MFLSSFKSQYCHSNFVRLPKALPAFLCLNRSVLHGLCSDFQPLAHVQNQEKSDHFPKRRGYRYKLTPSEFSPLWRLRHSSTPFNTSLMALHKSFSYLINISHFFNSSIDVSKFLSEKSLLALSYFIFFIAISLPIIVLLTKGVLCPTFPTET